MGVSRNPQARFVVDSAPVGGLTTWCRRNKFTREGATRLSCHIRKGVAGYLPCGVFFNGGSKTQNEQRSVAVEMASESDRRSGKK